MSKSKKSADSSESAKSNVIAGPAIAENTVLEQAKEARGEEEGAKDNGGDASLAPKSHPNSEEIKFKDETKEARVKHLESLGIDPDNLPAGPHKVETDAGSEPMYSGVVTVTSVSGEFDNSKISTRIAIGVMPRGLGWLKYAFKQHFPSANTDALFEVDPENKADPLLRTKFG